MKRSLISCQFVNFDFTKSTQHHCSHSLRLAHVPDRIDSASPPALPYAASILTYKQLFQPVLGHKHTEFV